MTSRSRGVKTRTGLATRSRRLAARRQSCRKVRADGSGSFTAVMPVVRGEHGSSGTWRIIEGTGRYETLRGMRTYTGTLISGNPDAFETIVYRTEWRGVVDFDADPPAIESLTASARKLGRRVRTYTLRVAFTTRDTALPVSYAVDVRSGRALLGLKRGSTASGHATASLRIQPPRTSRTARVLLTAHDALGNQTTTSRTVRLPSR